MVSVGQERMDELDPHKTVFQEISEGSSKQHSEFIIT